MSSPHLSQAKLKGNTYEYLAFWCQDDGSKCSNGFHLNTNAFSLED